MQIKSKILNATILGTTILTGCKGPVERVKESAVVSFVSDVFQGAAITMDDALAPIAPRGPLEQVKQFMFISPAVKKLSESTQQLQKDTTLKSFYKDTVEFADDDVQNAYGKLQQIASNVENFHVPQMKVGFTQGFVGPQVGVNHTVSGNGGTSIGLSSGSITAQDIRLSKYVDVQVAVENKIFTDQKGEKHYIPITAYGRENPMLSDKK